MSKVQQAKKAARVGPSTERVDAPTRAVRRAKNAEPLGRAPQQLSPERAEAFQVRRMEILRHSALIFAEDGYHQTSVNSLARRLGVSKPVLYYYAKNKDDLLYQCWEVARNALREAMEDANRAKLSGAGKLRRYYAAYAEIMCSDFGRCMALVDHRGLSARAGKKDIAGRRSIENAVRDMILEGQADGSIAPCDPAMAARALFGAFNGIPRWFRHEGKLGPAQVAEAYLDLFMTGLGRG